MRYISGGIYRMMHEGCSMQNCYAVPVYLVSIRESLIGYGIFGWIRLFCRELNQVVGSTTGEMYLDLYGKEE